MFQLGECGCYVVSNTLRDKTQRLNIFAWIKIVLGVFLIGLAVALSMWCAIIHLSPPPQGHMSGTDMSLIFVTAMFLLFALPLAIGGKALVQTTTKSKAARISTWLLLLPVGAAIAIVLYTVGKNVVDLM